MLTCSKLLIHLKRKIYLRSFLIQEYFVVSDSASPEIKSFQNA